MTTLVWAVFIFVVIVYLVSLVFREAFGRGQSIMDCDECGSVDMATYFNSVPRSMLTVFRFFFGDFTTLAGVNMYEGVQAAHGTWFCISVCIIFFVVSVGIFNVITAIFVESTLAAAKTLENHRQTERLNDSALWNTRIEVLIRHLFQAHGIPLIEGHLADSLEEFKDEVVIEEEFEFFIKQEEVVNALDDLEIDKADHRYLFDILDADNTGSLTLCEMIDGIRRLRGGPRRSDIITIDLMVREMQDGVHQVKEMMNTIYEAQQKNATKQNRSLVPISDTQ